MSEIVMGPHVKTELLRENRLRRRMINKLGGMLSVLWALVLLPLMVVSGWVWLSLAGCGAVFIMSACFASRRLWRAIKLWRHATIYGMARGRKVQRTWQEFWREDGQ